MLLNKCTNGSWKYKPFDVFNLYKYYEQDGAYAVSCFASADQLGLSARVVAATVTWHLEGSIPGQDKHNIIFNNDSSVKSLVSHVQQAFPEQFTLYERWANDCQISTVKYYIQGWSINWP